MSIEKMLEAMRRSVFSGVKIEPDGSDRYLIRTDFTYHGEEKLWIILKRDEETRQWILTDEGYTMKWLSSDGFEMSAARSEHFERILRVNNALSRDGMIEMIFPPERIGSALHSMIGTLLEVADIRFLLL